MKGITYKLEAVLFTGIILLRDERNLLKPEESLELRRTMERMERMDWRFWIIYWIFMPVLHIELIVLLLIAAIIGNMWTAQRKLKEWTGRH